MKPKDAIAGLLFAACMFAFGIWLLDTGPGALHSRTCGRAGCVSGYSIAWSAITIGAAMTLVVVIDLIPKAWKGESYELVQRVRSWNQRRKAPKYIHGKFPPRDEVAIEEAAKRSRASGPK